MAPGAPTSVVTTALTATSWVPTWTDGSLGNPQETYTLKCVASGSLCTATAVGTPVTGIARGAGSTYSGTAVTGLTPATSYDCFVIAVNSVQDVCSAADSITT